MRLETEPYPSVATASAVMGRVVTFYSYKGGTGRSMALANVAWLLALNNQRVLVIDWDLEAPGLHRFFHPFLSDKELMQQQGLLDYVEKLAAHSASADSRIADSSIDIFDYIVSLEWPTDSLSQIGWKTFGPLARVDLLGAGRQGAAYSTKLAAFNWVEFYERLGGRDLLNSAIGQLRSVYDFVLIDSRTGVSDTSGICTVELPDTLVVGFTLNTQSIKGASSIALSVISQRARRRQADGDRPDPFRVYPVPMRVEITAELDKRTHGLEVAKRHFRRCLEHAGISDAAAYWGKLQVAYFPYYAFEEIPAVFGDAPDQDLSLSTPIKQLTSIISDGEFANVPPFGETPDLSEKFRKEILGWYLRTTDLGLDPVQVAQQTYDSIPREQQATMLSVLARLIQISSSGRIEARTTDMHEMRHRSAVISDLTQAGVLVVTETQGGSSVHLKDPDLPLRWPVLRGWIASNKEALALRQSVIAALTSWKHSGRDRDALLRGRNLRDAMAADDAVDFSPEEREFLTRSAAAEKPSFANPRPLSVAQVSITMGFVTAIAWVLRANIFTAVVPTTDVHPAALALVRAVAMGVYFGLLVLGALLATRPRFGWRDEQVWLLPTCAAFGVVVGDMTGWVVFRQVPVTLEEFEGDIRLLLQFVGLAIGFVEALRQTVDPPGFALRQGLRVCLLAILGATLGTLCTTAWASVADSMGLVKLSRSPLWIPMLTTLILGMLASSPGFRLPVTAVATIIAGTAVACLSADLIGLGLLELTKGTTGQLRSFWGAVNTTLFFAALSGTLAYFLEHYRPAADQQFRREVAVASVPHH